MKKEQVGMAVLLFVVLVVSRLVPHPHNFTALTGVALFAGALWAGGSLRFIVPLLATLATDIYFGFYPGMEWTYLGIAAGVWLAPQLKASVLQVSVRAVLASVLFFVLSNVGVWWSSGLYTQDFTGLMQCFTMAIPFFHNTVVSGFVFSVFFFSVYRLVFFKNGFQGFVVAPNGR
ncbi:MAG: hypothetical protein IT287_01075 [Bdellovibrionaceae bacterium]|nr:hypothetical protein [Pseudobdellovibrionaceae bacterium]